MEQECKYIKELKKQQKKTMIILIIFFAVILILYKIVHWNSILELFKDNNGDFSNEILWTAVGAIGGIIAFLGVVITIICTEKTRIKQNKYDYIKSQKELELSQFKTEVKHQLDILNPMNAIEISMNTLNDDNYRDISTQLDIYACKVKAIPWNIHWYYDNNIIYRMSKYKEFMEIVSKDIEQITQIINNYTSYIVNWFLNKNIYRNLRDLEKCTALEPNEKKQLEQLKLIYEDINKQNESIKVFLNYKMELVKLSNERMPILENKAKEMIEERNNFIKEELNNIK